MSEQEQKNNKSEQHTGMRCMQRNRIYAWISEMLRERINSRGDEEQEIEWEKERNYIVQ